MHSPWRFSSIFIEITLLATMLNILINWSYCVFSLHSNILINWSFCVFSLHTVSFSDFLLQIAYAYYQAMTVKCYIYGHRSSVGSSIVRTVAFFLIYCNLKLLVLPNKSLIVVGPSSILPFFSFFEGYNSLTNSSLWLNLWDWRGAGNFDYIWSRLTGPI